MKCGKSLRWHWPPVTLIVAVSWLVTISQHITVYAAPTRSPTKGPTTFPTTLPTTLPTRPPTTPPTTVPSRVPTTLPTTVPSKEPTSPPTKAPTQSPTGPTLRPTTVPTERPSQAPTLEPTQAPTPSPKCAPRFFWENCTEAVSECFRCYGCCDQYMASMAVVGGRGGAQFNCSISKSLGGGSSCAYEGTFGSCECATETYLVCVQACAKEDYGLHACSVCSNLVGRWPDQVDFF